ncbi:uncharacterized protein K02A2.6-like [Wyeomyia smithii]|uniref:uncharacterized protein K02A2.6-like n=1 Tax=Wyeomyia smithii TaxID=174621 RepID=UPI002467D641|nr:uncharacterized protein K02A2.6-like [Wyeomyia smithii]
MLRGRSHPQIQLFVKTPTKVPLESWPIPDKPWSRIHIDYAGPVDGFNFLVIVDPYSKWPEVHVTKSTTKKATLKLLNHSFATFGVPETIVSDNGTQFTSQEFQTFCSSQGIRHIRIAPYHPQSNGLAERFVDTLKRSLRKIRSGGKGLEEALNTFLQVYRSTPTDDLGNKSPAEIMLGRPVRTISSLLKPCDSGILLRNKTKQNDAFNKRHGAVHRGFKQGDLVYAKIYAPNSWQWKPATVIEKIGAVNYNVLLEEGNRLIRSHANHLKTRFQKCCSSEKHPSPLSIFFDGFGLNIPAEVPQNVPANVQVRKGQPLDNEVDPNLTNDFSDEGQPLDNEVDPNLTNDFSDEEAAIEKPNVRLQTTPAVKEPVQFATPILERGRRMIGIKKNNLVQKPFHNRELYCRA